MKLITSTLAFGLICVAGSSAAQDQMHTTTLRNVTVNAVPGQYESYVADLDTGYALRALVGTTHRQFVQAKRAADRSESVRRSGAFATNIAVAIDNSSGPGLARQIQLLDPDRNTVSIVNVYCRRAVVAGDPHCALVPMPTQTGNAGVRLTSTQAAFPQVVEVNLGH